MAKTTKNGTIFDFAAGDGKRGGDALIVPLTLKPQPALELVSAADRVCDQAVSGLLNAGAVGAEAGAIAHTSRGGAFRRVVVVSLGEESKLDAPRIRAAAGGLARWLMAERIHRAALWLDGLLATKVPTAAADWASGMALAGFRFSELKTDEDKTPARVRIALLARENGHVGRVREEIRGALTVVDAVNYARRLAHQPPNIINPRTLAEEARGLARRCKLKCTVFDVPQLQKMKMNGLLAVGRSALYGPCLIQLEYRGAPRAKTTIVLVGKAVTFDTGGYSIKPADGMEAMKFDKCGGMTVLGLMKSVADLKLKCNVVGLIAAAENAISENAYRPGDIVTMMSGKTVEIISTDAEGRMILGDALWYAQQQFKPAALIDLATLTGGVRIALGSSAAGLMGNDDNLADDLMECGRLTHERLWRLPLWDDYRELIRGTDSDIRNTANRREAHAIVGGMFLKEFIQDGQSWAHLDIAAVAWRDDNKGASGKGATGFGVRLLTEYLRRRAGT